MLAALPRWGGNTRWALAGMADRYYSAEPIASPTVRLTDAEAHHLLHVGRGRPGDAVTLFDGSGAEFDAIIEDVGRADCTLRILQRREACREPALAITLAVALPKGDRQRWLVEKLTELGVQTLVPLATERSVAEAGSAALVRLRRTVVEASKQCGRNQLMQIAEPVAWKEYARSVNERPLRCIADPSAKHGWGQIAELLGTLQRAGIVLAVGPEGGFTEDEYALAQQQGWMGLSLGPAILRVETAAIALAALAAACSPQLNQNR